MKEHPELPIFGPEDRRLDPPNPPEVKPWRSLAKAISWRVVGTLDTLVLSYVMIAHVIPFLGLGEGGETMENLETASYIAFTEVATKMLLYYLHERGWARLGWGMAHFHGRSRPTFRRSATKTATWRVIASLDTFLLALIFTGNVSTAVSIGGFEIVTKLALYFFHERAWGMIKAGRA